MKDNQVPMLLTFVFQSNVELLVGKYLPIKHIATVLESCGVDAK